MSELAAFLLAQIAADEATAREAAAGLSGRWVQRETGREMVSDESGGDVINYGGLRYVDDAIHIARHDPARVLAECEAKRRIVEWHKNWPVLVETPTEIERFRSADPSSFALRASQKIAWMTEREYVARFGTEPPTSPILRLLALPYSDHDDYRDEWRP